MTSLCPARYFVALCITMSTPSRAGWQFSGVANVESRIVMIPRRRAIAHTSFRSVSCSRGLLGVSRMNGRVAGVTAAANASLCVWSTRVTLTPKPGSTWSSSVDVPM